MAKRWIGVALIAWCLAATTAAQAQMALPDPGGMGGGGMPGGGMPGGGMPGGGMQGGGNCQPQLVPGPLTSGMAPPGPPPSDCLSLPANTPNAFTEECCPPCPCVWTSAEYIYWALKSPRLDSTLVTSDPNPPPGNNPPVGQLGGATTQEVLRSDSIKYSPSSGARLSFGFWFDSHNCVGFEATGFILGERSHSFRANSDRTGRQLITLPIFDIQGVRATTVNNGPGEFVYAVAIPDGRIGGVTVSSSTSLWGAEANLTNLFYQSCGFGASVIGGFRYVDLNENLQIGQQSVAIGGSTINFGVPFPDPNSISVLDRFRGRNQFYGGQAGVRAAASWRQLFFAVQGKIAIGDMHEVTEVSGVSTLNMANVSANNATAVIPPASIAVGRYALQSNIGRHVSDRFAIVPEAEGRFGINLSENVICFVGYNFLYMNHVARPGDQIDRGISLTQVPTAQEYNASIPGDRPRVPFTQSYFWAQGVDFGLEVSY